MSRWEFMRQLEELLSDISPNEREEALQYYNDYFNDAGREQEASVIEALGSPEQVANIVKEGLGDSVSRGEFTENGFQSQSFEESRNEMIKSASTGTKEPDDAGEKRQEDDFSAGGDAFGENTQESQCRQGDESRQQDAGDEGGYTAYDRGKKKEMPTWAIVLIVIACFIGSPVILGALCGIAGALIGIVVTLLAMVLGFGLTAMILFVVGVALFVAGVGCFVYSPIEAIGLAGGGFICIAIGILFMLVTVLIMGKGLPALWRGISYCINRMFGKKGEKL